MSDWKEIARPGDVSTWEPDENEELEGTLTRITRNVGQNGSTIYEITLASGELCGVWETAVLKSKLEQVPVGSEVKIIYLGKRKSKKGPGTYKDYKVMSRPAEKTDAEKIFSDKDLPF